MEPLWAPWRMEFIRAPKDGACFLCDAVGVEPAGDRACHLVCRGVRAFVIFNKYPYNNGHLLVAPNRHEGRFTEVTAEELAEIDALAQGSIRIIREEMRAEGFNVGYNLGAAAGAGVKDHVHLHVVPRWVGDTNFMPVIGDTHVIPQALDELYDRLRPRFEELAKDVAR